MCWPRGVWAQITDFYLATLEGRGTNHRLLVGDLGIMGPNHRHLFGDSGRQGPESQTLFADPGRQALKSQTLFADPWDHGPKSQTFMWLAWEAGAQITDLYVLAPGGLGPNHRLLFGDPWDHGPKSQTFMWLPWEAGAQITNIYEVTAVGSRPDPRLLCESLQTTSESIAWTDRGRMQAIAICPCNDKFSRPSQVGAGLNILIINLMVCHYYFFFFFICMFYQVLGVSHSSSSTPTWGSVLPSIVETRDQKSRGCPLLFSNRNLGSFYA